MNDSAISKSSKIQRSCQFCGKDFLCDRYQVKVGGGKFCCKPCKYAHARANKKTATQQPCQQCGNLFWVAPNRIKRNEGKYCSQKCSAISRQVMPETLTCPTCNNVFERYHWEVKRSKSVVACSQKCAFIERKRQSEEKHKSNGCKICPQCKIVKPLSDFYNASRERSGRTVYCMDCTRTRSLKYRPNQHIKRAITKSRLVLELGGKCVRCGAADLPICCYDFHHKSGSKKEFNISQYLSNPTVDAKEEIAKCELLCRYCHAIEHAKYSTLSASDTLKKHSTC